MRYLIDGARNSLTNKPYFVTYIKYIAFALNVQKALIWYQRQNNLFNDKMKIQIYCPSNMLQTLCKFLPHNEQQRFIYFYFILTTSQIFIAVTESTIVDHQNVAYNFQSTKLLSFAIERLGLYITHI